MTPSDELRIRPLGEWFVLPAGAILAITGLAKIWTGLGDSKFLAVVDPIIGLKFGQLMLALGVAEIAVALMCFLSKRQTLVSADGQNQPGKVE